MTGRQSTRESRAGCDVLLAVDAYLPRSGGSRIYYDNLYRRLADRYGFAIRVETSHCSGDDVFDRNSRCSGIDIRRRGTRLTDWSVKRIPSLARKMLRIVRGSLEAAPTAIHCGDLFPQDFTGMLLQRATGLPFLVFVHGDEISQTESRRLQPRVRDAIYRSANAVVAANAYAYERAMAICGGPERLSMITPGVDCEAFQPGGRSEWLSRQYGLGNSPVVVTVARLVKKKGHETVLRSLPGVLSNIPDLKYLVVGGGPEECRLKKLAAELGIDHCVRFTGDVAHHLLPEFYRAADVFCMVNQRDASGDIESFGMVFIEAGASGKPVIGGRSGGTTQSIIEGQTGLFCDPGNSAQLSELLLMLLQDANLCHRMGEAGLARARRDFDWELRAQQLFDVHREITKSRQPGAQPRYSCQAH